MQPQGMWPFNELLRSMLVLFWQVKTFIVKAGGKATLDFGPETAAILGLRGVYALVLDKLYEVRPRMMAGCTCSAEQHMAGCTCSAEQHRFLGFGKLHMLQRCE